MDAALSELITFLKEASPLVWSTLIKQVYVEAFANIAWAIGLVVISYLLAKFAKHCDVMQEEDSYNDTEWGIGKFFSYFGSVVAGCVSFGLLVSAIMHFANPEFYAIRFILSTIGGS